jgi:hypothetical protein
MNCITNGTQEPLPFANFSEVPIRMVAGTFLGTLEECPKTTPHPGSLEVCNVFMNLADMIQGIPLPDTTEPDKKHPAGYPFLVRPPAEPEPELDKADISTHWGDDVYTKIRSMLEKHKGLFRPQLGCFNDGVTMPIPFRDGIDIKDLRQPLYPLSKRDRNTMNSILDPMKQDGSLKDVLLGHP